MNHRRRKNKVLEESALEVCSFKKGFEEHGDILTCIWQDQVWLQFIAAISSALGKTEPTASRWRGAKEEHIRAVTLLTLSQLFSAPSLFGFLLCWTQKTNQGIQSSEAAAALGSTHHPHPLFGNSTLECVQGGRSSIPAQSPTPSRVSLSPGPGWNVAPLPPHTQDRWQDRRACWRSKALPARRRWHPGKALAWRGHQDQCSLPWSLPPSRDCWKDLRGKGGSPLLDATMQIFKRSPHISCVLLD